MPGDSRRSGHIWAFPQKTLVSSVAKGPRYGKVSFDKCTHEKRVMPIGDAQREGRRISGSPNFSMRAPLSRAVNTTPVEVGFHARGRGQAFVTPCCRYHGSVDRRISPWESTEKRAADKRSRGERGVSLAARTLKRRGFPFDPGVYCIQDAPSCQALSCPFGGRS